MNGAIKKAEQIVAELGDKAYMLQQFNNPDNIKVRMETILSCRVAGLNPKL
jgi:cysteine synthase A